MTSDCEVDVRPGAEPVDGGRLEQSSHSPRTKITRRLGALSPHLHPIHDGRHCSVERMAWA